MILAHQIALDPTVKQRNLFARAAGCSRFAYNWGHAEWDRQYKAGEKPNAYQIRNRFNAIKGKEFPWMYESPAGGTNQAFLDLGTGYTGWFKGLKGQGPKVGHPKKHKKGKNDGFYLLAATIHFEGRSVILPVIGKVKLYEDLRYVGKILSARVKRVADKWYISVQVEGEFRVPNTPKREIVGVDLGIKTAIKPSQGDSFNSPKPLKKLLKKIKKQHRLVSRKVKGSANRKKAVKKLARTYAHIANVRKDFVHKATTQLCRENQAVVIEDLNVAGMMKNHCLALAISDVGFGMIREQIMYKAEKFGCSLYIADRWFPSSKRCHMCGEKKEELSLSERTYICEYCGLVEDRDLNAALNLEQYLRLSGNLTPVDTRPKVFKPRKGKKARSVAETGTKTCQVGVLTNHDTT